METLQKAAPRHHSSFHCQSWPRPPNHGPAVLWAMLAPDPWVFAAFMLSPVMFQHVSTYFTRPLCLLAKERLAPNACTKCHCHLGFPSMGIPPNHPCDFRIFINPPAIGVAPWKPWLEPYKHLDGSWSCISLFFHGFHQIITQAASRLLKRGQRSRAALLHHDGMLGPIRLGKGQDPRA